MRGPIHDETISVDQFLAHPPQQVWRALTTPDQLARWWLEVTENERLDHSFGDWTLTWRLVPERTGTRLFLDHSGFDPARPDHAFAYDHMGPDGETRSFPGSQGSSTRTRRPATRSPKHARTRRLAVLVLPSEQSTRMADWTAQHHHPDAQPHPYLHRTT